MNDELDIAAAEYVLGTLPADERTAFAARLESEPALRAAVVQWQARLSSLDASAEAVTPRTDVWRAIEAAINERRGAAEFATASNVILLQRRLSRWRGAALLGGALAAALAAVVVIDRASLAPEIGARYVAVVDSGGREPALIAEVDTATGLIRVRSLAAETPAGRSLELWHVAEGSTPARWASCRPILKHRRFRLRPAQGRSTV